MAWEVESEGWGVEGKREGRGEREGGEERGRGREGRRKGRNGVCFPKDFNKCIPSRALLLLLLFSH